MSSSNVHEFVVSGGMCDEQQTLDLKAIRIAMRIQDFLKEFFITMGWTGADPKTLGTALGPRVLGQRSLLTI